MVQLLIRVPPNGGNSKQKSVKVVVVSNALCKGVVLNERRNPPVLETLQRKDDFLIVNTSSSKKCPNYTLHGS